MKKYLTISAALVAGSMLASQVHAAVLTMSDNVDAAYLNDGATLDSNYQQGITTGPVKGTTGDIYEIPLYFQISSLLAGELGFGSVDFNVTSTGAITLDNTNAPYASNSAQYTSGKSSKPYYFANFAATGNLTPTLQEIAASIAGGVTSGPDSTIGQSGPFLIGYIYADYNGAVNGGVGSVSVSVNAFNTNDTGGVLVADTAANGGSSVNPSTISFVPAPEPASLGMLGLGAMGLIARRRRTA